MAGPSSCKSFSSSQRVGSSATVKQRFRLRRKNGSRQARWHRRREGQACWVRGSRRTGCCDPRRPTPYGCWIFTPQSPNVVSPFHGSNADEMIVAAAEIAKHGWLPLIVGSAAIVSPSPGNPFGSIRPRLPPVRSARSCLRRPAGCSSFAARKYRYGRCRPWSAHPRLPCRSNRRHR